MQSHLESLQAAHQQEAENGRQQQTLITDLQDQVAELGATGYSSGLGLRVEKSLQVAEDHAERLMAQADLDAERLRRSTETETQRLLVQAQARADELVVSATEQAEILITSARNDIARQAADASTEQERLLTEAREAAAHAHSSTARSVTERLEAADHDARARLAQAQAERQKGSLPTLEPTPMSFARKPSSRRRASRGSEPRISAKLTQNTRDSHRRESAPVPSLKPESNVRKRSLRSATRSVNVSSKPQTLSSGDP